MSSPTWQLRTALAEHRFFATMAPELVRPLTSYVYHHEYAPGRTLLREHHEANRFYLIRKGLVRLDIDLPGTGPVAVETISAGSALGWSWLFPPYEWHFTATALEPTSALVLDAPTLRALMASYPELGYEMVRRVSGILFDRLQALRLRIGDTELALPIASRTGPWAGEVPVEPAHARHA